MAQRLRIPGIPRLFLIIAALALLFPTPLILAQGTAVFSRIDVSGNQRIEADTIRVFAGIEPGTGSLGRRSHKRSFRATNAATRQPLLRRGAAREPVVS